MPSLKQHAGYLEIDHRDSPGIVATDVAHMPGAVAVGAGKVGERDVVMCKHCQRGIVLEPLRTRDRGYCPKCDHYVCDSCETIRAKSGDCIPFVKVMDIVNNHVEKLIGRENNSEAAINPLIHLTDN